VALECLKKNRQQQLEAQPYLSTEFLQTVKECGGLKACMRYLEYLVNDCQVGDERVHTELVCLYIECIKSAMGQQDGGVDLRVKIVGVLEGPQQRYDPQVVFEIMPTDSMAKERAIIMVKL